MKRFLMILVTLAMAVSCCGQRVAMPTMFAHRGCWSKAESGEFAIPENSIAAVAMAARMGYAGIECDVRLTKDGKMVILHDKKINRTLRRASDYSKVEEPVYIADLTFEQVRNEYVMESTNPQLRVPIPTLEELLAECKRVGIIPMLHSSVPQSYRVAQEMFGDEWICFTADYELLPPVREFSNCLILYSIDKGTAEEVIPYLEKIGGKCGVSSMKYRLYTPEFCKTLTAAGYQVQASIFKSPREVVAQRNGITYQLSDFSIMPSGKPYDKWSSKGEGSYEWSEVVECGATVVEIDYCGTIEVVVNGNRTYTLTRETAGRDIIGNRHFDIAPKVAVRQVDGTISRVRAKVYKY